MNYSILKKVKAIHYLIYGKTSPTPCSNEEACPKDCQACKEKYQKLYNKDEETTKIISIISEIIHLLNELPQNVSWINGYPKFNVRKRDWDISHNLYLSVKKVRSFADIYVWCTGKRFPTIETIYCFNKQNPNSQDKWADLDYEITQPVVTQVINNSNRISVVCLCADTNIGSFYEVTDKIEGRKYLFLKPISGEQVIQIFKK
jgi:hypothetical protein